MNDFYLLSLARESEEARLILHTKYEPLIKATIGRFHVNKSDVDDYFQEGRIALEKAINKFDESQGKSFTMFFKMVLENTFKTIKVKNRKISYVFTPEVLYTNEVVENYSPIIPVGLNESESELFSLLINQGYKPREIAKLKQENIKSVYNAVARLKKKLRDLDKR